MAKQHIISAHADDEIVHTTTRIEAVFGQASTHPKCKLEVPPGSQRDDMNEARHDEAKPAPFDTARLDALLEEEGIDVVVATSKHNVQYLLGGYRFFFFDYMDAIGVSRYLPVMVYQKGRPDNSAYIGCHLESHEKQLGKFWPRVVDDDLMQQHQRDPAGRRAYRGLPGPIGKVGVEASFLPWDGAKVLQDGLSNCQFVDAYFHWSGCVRERRKPNSRVAGGLRACPGLDARRIRRVCARPNKTPELVDRLRREEVQRGLTFEYCLMSAGTSFNRAPSDQRLESGDIFSLDSGGNYKGYIGDLCRMGILGEPDAELVDLLGVIEEIQQRARRPIRRGTAGAEIFAAAHELVDASSHRGISGFCGAWHGPRQSRSAALDRATSLGLMRAMTRPGR